ncbi:MAG TPA: hypothetical protein VHH92_00690 [Actinomycetota bacterium]|nr:hypothetical protein [Actinomycetota bacterium]
MGESAAATVREIEDIRARIENNMRELERRVPEPGLWLKRMAGIAVGGGAATIVTMAVLKRARARREKKTARNVERIAKRSPTAIEVVPEPVAAPLAAAIEDGRWKQWAAVAGGVWLAFRLIELRQLGRLNRSLGDA